METKNNEVYTVLEDSFEWDSALGVILPASMKGRVDIEEMAAAASVYLRGLEEETNELAQNIFYNKSEMGLLTRAIARRCLLGFLHDRYPTAKEDLLARFMGVSIWHVTKMLSWHRRNLPNKELDEGYFRKRADYLFGQRYSVPASMINNIVEEEASRTSKLNQNLAVDFPKGEPEIEILRRLGFDACSELIFQAICKRLTMDYSSITSEMVKSVSQRRELCHAKYISVYFLATIFPGLDVRIYMKVVNRDRTNFYNMHFKYLELLEKSEEFREKSESVWRCLVRLAENQDPSPPQ